MIGNPPDADGVDGAVGQPVERAAQVVQPVVAVDRGHHGHRDLPPQQGPQQIGPGAVAVDNLKALVPDHMGQGVHHGKQIALGQHPGIDSHFPGLLGEGSLEEADQPHGLGAAQPLEQAQHMGLGSAHIAAGNEVHDLHGIAPLEKLSLFCPISAEKSRLDGGLRAVSLSPI